MRQHEDMSFLVNILKRYNLVNIKDAVYSVKFQTIHGKKTTNVVQELKIT